MATLDRKDQTKITTFLIINFQVYEVWLPRQKLPGKLIIPLKCQPLYLSLVRIENFLVV